MECPKCKTANSANAKFCKSCGSIIGKSEKKRCPHGHVLDPTWGGRCAICESGGDRPAPSPDGGPHKGKTIREEGLPPFPPDMGKSGQPIRKTKMEPGTMSEPSPTPPDPNVPRPDSGRRRKKTMVMSDYAQEGQNEGVSEARRLVGFLVTYSHKPAGEFFELREGRYVIGSGTRSDIYISDNMMSSEHAILLFRRGKFLFRDNLSTNGSFVNGEEVIGDIEVGNYDNINMGDTEFRLIKIDD